jgi:hypothetical protein
MEILILRRGMDEDYYRFMQIIADTNGFALIVDRRTTERRRDAWSHDVERRVGDRRCEPPPSWQTEGFISLGEPEHV